MASHDERTASANSSKSVYFNTCACKVCVRALQLRGLTGWGPLYLKHRPYRRFGFFRPNFMYSLVKVLHYSGAVHYCRFFCLWIAWLWFVGAAASANGRLKILLLFPAIVHAYIGDRIGAAMKIVDEHGEKWHFSTSVIVPAFNIHTHTHIANFNR